MMRKQKLIQILVMVSDINDINDGTNDMNDVEYNSDYYTPHFPHTTKALRMMRSLLVEIMDGDKKENTTSHSNSNDAF